MDSDTAMDSSTARGLLMLRPILTTPTDSDTPDTMVLVTLDTMVSDSDTMAMDSDTPTARGLLMLSLRLRLIPTTDTVLDTMVLDTEFMESVPLMPSQKLTPTFCMEDMDTLDMPDTMDIPMVDMPTMDKLFPLISKWTANHPCFLYQ